MGIFDKKEEENQVKKPEVIDIETSTAEFDRFCEEWEIENDITSMAEDERIDFKKLKDQFISAVKKGRLSVNNDGTLRYDFSDKSPGKEPITIKRPSGSSYMEMDKYKEQQGVHKTYAVLGAMTKHAPAYFSDIDGIDLKPLQAIITLFLAG